MIKIFVYLILLITIMAVSTEAHESNIYTIEDAERSGMCNAIIVLLRAGLSVNSPYIQAIVDAQKDKFGTNDLKLALNICAETLEKQKANVYESIDNAFDDVLSEEEKK